MNAYVIGMMNSYRDAFYEARCEQPNVLIPAEGFLVGDTDRDLWLLPEEVVEWLKVNVGAESYSTVFWGERKWNWAITRDCMAVHFVFANKEHAALFKMMWG